MMLLIKKAETEGWFFEDNSNFAPSTKPAGLAKIVSGTIV